MSVTFTGRNMEGGGHTVSIRYLCQLIQDGVLSAKRWGDLNFEKAQIVGGRDF